MSRKGYQQITSNPFEDLVDDDSQYAALQQEVTGAIKTFSSNTNALTKLVGSVGTKREQAGDRDRVHELIAQNKRLAKDTTLKLKKMQGLRSADPREQQQRQIICGRLTGDLQTWVQKFQDASALDLTKEKAGPSSSGAGNNNSNANPFGKSSPSSVAYNEPPSTYSASPSRAPEFREAQLTIDEDDDINAQLVAERNREIREIEQSVVEVGQIFQDLAAMVNEQGVMVDNIEANISSATTNTSEGVKQLNSAEEYQIKARKKCIIITIIVVVAIAIIVLILLFALKIIRTK